LDSSFVVGSSKSIIQYCKRKLIYILHFQWFGFR